MKEVYMVVMERDGRRKKREKEREIKKGKKCELLFI
jgi:hypothetical protein